MLLDCTFRDGGYYTDWNFSPELVSEYLTAVDKAGIDIVEIGFRSFEYSGFRGPFYYSSDRYLKTLGLDNYNFRIAVMVDAKSSDPNLITRYFNPVNESPVDAVRIATNFENLDRACQLAVGIKSLGYETIINMMQIHMLSHDQIVEATLKIDECADVMYFADSIGCLNSEMIDDIYGSIRTASSDIAVGIHAHDNKGNALNNTVFAMMN